MVLNSCFSSFHLVNAEITDIHHCVWLPVSKDLRRKTMFIVPWLAAVNENWFHIKIHTQLWIIFKNTPWWIHWYPPFLHELTFQIDVSPSDWESKVMTTFFSSHLKPGSEKSDVKLKVVLNWYHKIFCHLSNRGDHVKVMLLVTWKLSINIEKCSVLLSHPSTDSH